MNPKNITNINNLLIFQLYEGMYKLIRPKSYLQKWLIEIKYLQSIFINKSNITLIYTGCETKLGLS